MWCGATYSAVHGSVFVPRGNRLPASRVHTYQLILACDGGNAKEERYLFALKAQNGIPFWFVLNKTIEA